ncbi:MAG: hypothetical protein ACO4AN_04565 [Candidatus Nanopelagicales bacterium]
MKELKPIHTDGLNELKVGISIFSLFFLLFSYRYLVQGHETALFWLQVSLAGVILGFMGYWVMLKRKQKSA